MEAARILVVDDDPLTVMTARDRAAESEILAREAGIVYYAPKPIGLRRLRAVMAKALGAPAEPAAPGTAQRRDTDE